MILCYIHVFAGYTILFPEEQGKHLGNLALS